MEDSQKIILYMISVCVIFMLIMIFHKPIKIFLKMLIQAAVGLLCIFLVNFITAPLGITVGLNVITAAVVGILGIPGFLCLYAAQLLLQ